MRATRYLRSMRNAERAPDKFVYLVGQSQTREALAEALHTLLHCALGE